MAKENPVDRDIEAALKTIEEQVELLRKVQDNRKRGLKAAETRRRRQAKAKA
jgi:hypothetical protein